MKGFNTAHNLVAPAPLVLSAAMWLEQATPVCAKVISAAFVSAAVKMMASVKMVLSAFLTHKPAVFAPLPVIATPTAPVILTAKGIQMVNFAGLNQETVAIQIVRRSQWEEAVREGALV